MHVLLRYSRLWQSSWWMLGTEGIRRQEQAGRLKGYQEGNVSCTITYQSDSKTHVLWAGYDLIWVSGQLVKVDLLIYLSQYCKSGPWSTENFLKTFIWRVFFSCLGASLYPKNVSSSFFHGMIFILCFHSVTTDTSLVFVRRCLCCDCAVLAEMSGVPLSLQEANTVPSLPSGLPKLA